MPSRQLKSTQIISKKTMTKINNQSNSLDSIEFVQDISPESAANYSGGAEFFFGDDTNFADIVLHIVRQNKCPSAIAF